MSTFPGRCSACRNRQDIECDMAVIATDNIEDNSIIYFDCPACNRECWTAIVPEMADHLNSLGVPRIVRSLTDLVEEFFEADDAADRLDRELKLLIPGC